MRITLSLLQVYSRFSSTRCCTPPASMTAYLSELLTYDGSSSSRACFGAGGATKYPDRVSLSLEKVPQTEAVQLLRTLCGSSTTDGTLASGLAVLLLAWCSFCSNRQACWPDSGSEGWRSVQPMGAAAESAGHASELGLCSLGELQYPRPHDPLANPRDRACVAAKQVKTQKKQQAFANCSGHMMTGD